jgi:solute carrier family 25 phosphate transporter 3
LAGGFARIAREEGVAGFYAGFGPILFKQVPYTMAKFAVFEVAQEKLIAATGKTKDQLVGSQLTGVNLAGGLIAGMAAAVVCPGSPLCISASLILYLAPRSQISQPADTLLSKINKTKGEPGQGTTSRLVQLAGQLGAKGLFTGLGARLVMIGTLTAGQFMIYGKSNSSLLLNRKLMSRLCR